MHEQAAAEDGQPERLKSTVKSVQDLRRHPGRGAREACARHELAAQRGKLKLHDSEVVVLGAVRPGLPAGEALGLALLSVWPAAQGRYRTAGSVAAREIPRAGRCQPTTQYFRRQRDHGSGMSQFPQPSGPRPSARNARLGAGDAGRPSTRTQTFVQLLAGSITRTTRTQMSGHTCRQRCKNTARVAG